MFENYICTVLDCGASDLSTWLCTMHHSPCYFFVPPFPFPPSLYPLREPHLRLNPSRRWRCSASPPSFSSDESAIIEATARVTFHLAQSDLTDVTTFELLAFCNVKGLPVNSNIWNRTALETTARAFSQRERLGRIRKGTEWEAMSEARQVRLSHEICNAEGDVTYIDPATKYTVFSYFGHLKRGYCCGVKETGEGFERTHRCRHCPFTENGELKGDRMVALKERVAVIERSRERAQEIWRSGMTEQSGFGQVKEMERVQEQGRSVPDDDGLVKKFAKIQRRTRAVKDGEFKCAECADEKYVTCTRCSGWTFLVSPRHMDCPQCEAKGYHPCVSCTPFRPKSRSSFYA